jgi:dipeptidyl aminopeptidase/acylaminoacyl peptidase
MPADYLVVRWSPDGSWLLVFQRSVNERFEVSEAYHRYVLATGKIQTITDRRSYYNADLSPDGKTLIGFGEPGLPPDPTNRSPRELSRFDVATGAVTKADKFAQKPDDMFAMSRWSPDGRRVALALREIPVREPGEDPKKGAQKESFRVVVCDPDGGNEVKLTASQGQFAGRIYWLPTRPKAAPAPK